MIVKASVAEVMLSGVFSLHSSHRGRRAISCPRAKVWLKRNRHSLAEVAMEEGLEIAVDALNAVSRAGATSNRVVVLSLLVVAVLALGGFLAAARKK
jgi:hypothetical protein